MEWKELSMTALCGRAVGSPCPAGPSSDLPAFPTSCRYGERDHAVAVPFALAAGPET